MWSKKRVGAVCATIIVVYLALAVTSMVYANDVNGKECLMTLSLSPDWARPNEEVQLSVHVGDSNRMPYADLPLSIKMDGETFLDDANPMTNEEGRYQTYFDASADYGVYEIVVSVELNNNTYSKSINLTVDPNPDENQPIGERDSGSNNEGALGLSSEVGIFVGVAIVCIGLVSGLYVANRKRK